MFNFYFLRNLSMQSSVPTFPDWYSDDIPDIFLKLFKIFLKYCNTFNTSLHNLTNIEHIRDRYGRFKARGSQQVFVRHIAQWERQEEEVSILTDMPACQPTDLWIEFKPAKISCGCECVLRSFALSALSETTWPLTVLWRITAIR